MNRYMRSLLLILAILTVPLTGYTRAHGERYTIDLHDTYFRSSPGDTAIVHLKRQLRNRYPRVDLSNVNLEEVILIAKSRKGRSRAQLRIGDEIFHGERIPGSRGDFHNSDDYTFHRIVLENPGADSRGVWQLYLSGHVIARQATLVFSGYKQTTSFEVPNRSWGTRMEGERYCGTPSSNAADGWGAPQNICYGSDKTRYTHGYPPLRLYVRPDIDAARRDHMHVIRELEVDVTAIARNRMYHAHESVSFGIDIGGQTHRSQFSLAPSGSRDGSLHTATLKVRGHWRPDDLRDSKIWILPNQSSADFKVQQLQLRIVDYR